MFAIYIYIHMCVYVFAIERHDDVEKRQHAALRRLATQLIASARISCSNNFDNWKKSEWIASLCLYLHLQAHVCVCGHPFALELLRSIEKVDFSHWKLFVAISVCSEFCTRLLLHIFYSARLLSICSFMLLQGYGCVKLLIASPLEVHAWFL